jgi:hypothetical protein
MERARPSNTLGDLQSAGHSLFAVCRHSTCRHSKEIDVPRLIQSIGPHHYLLPDRSELHFSDKMRCPSCKRRGVNLWLRPAEPKKTVFAPAPPKQPNFTIVDHGTAPYAGHEVIATADNLMVGKGAFAAAALFYRDRRISLKQGAFVLADSKDGKPIDVMTAERYIAMREGEAHMAGMAPRTKAS